MNEILKQQLAADFCCEPQDVECESHVFTVYERQEGRRRYHETEECFLKIAAIRGKLLVSANAVLLPWCEKELGGCNGAWYFDAPQLAKLNAELRTYDYEIASVHPFYISEEQSEVNVSGYDIKEYDHDAIEQFRGDTRFCEAYSFEPDAPDMLGVSAARDGKLLGMAGASADSPVMWQIGINVEPFAKGQGIGSKLTALLKNRVLSEGRLPFYGTAFSHIASQNVAAKAGFRPTWCELSTRKIK